jgi:indole-3-glycerol phosphate synthase
MILDEIAARARVRVAAAKERLSLSALREAALALSAAPPNGPPGTGVSFPFEKALAGPGLAFICEVKKASPSKGLIAADFPYLRIAGEYEAAGAAAISVLTEPEYFLGSDTHLKEIAAAVSLPVLCKDFIIDEYQIFEAKILGASAALLICALLDAGTLRAFIKTAASLGLSTLVEVHDEREAGMALDAGAWIIGINNRDLKTFTVDLTVTERLRPLVPKGHIVVSESGVHSGDDVKRLADCGVDALLVGESFMKAPDKKVFLAGLRAAAGSPAGSGGENFLYG